MHLCPILPTMMTEFEASTQLDALGEIFLIA